MIRHETTWSDEERAEWNQINELFDHVIHVLKIQEYEIFRRVYSNKEEARSALRKFLCDVSTCEEHVLRYCREQIQKAEGHLPAQ